MKQFQHSFFKTSALALLVLASATSTAEKADKNKPAVIDADRATHNELTQTQVFEGNVVMVKGTMVIKANRVEARTDQEGYQMAVAFGAAGKPATFKQKRDGLEETIEAEATTINFDGKADTITLTDQAIVRRFAKTVMQDESRGAVIKYSNQTEFYEVKGGPTSSYAGGRVQTILAPRAPTSK